MPKTSGGNSGGGGRSWRKSRQERGDYGPVLKGLIFQGKIICVVRTECTFCTLCKQFLASFFEFFEVAVHATFACRHPRWPAHSGAICRLLWGERFLL